jgi:hypothetical protein
MVIVSSHRALLFSFTFFLSVPAIIDLNAQSGENQNWYFGVKAGLDFSTSPPTALDDGMTSEVNATACMSDSEGNLLFYTDGNRIWNRHHQIMTNGDGIDGYDGNYAQQVVIVHDPENIQSYYVFYVSEASYPVHRHRLKYSIVNMSNGDGVVESKNTVLPTDDIIVKIAAVEKRGEAFRIVTQGEKTGKYFCFKGTPAGIEQTPVITDTGVPNEDSYDYGDLRFSPDGKMLAATNAFSGMLSLFRFDFESGILTEPIFISADRPTSVEFSGNGTLLYVTSFANCSQNRLYQYGVSLYSQNQIVSSRMLLGIAPNIGMLRRGPDGRIYVGRRDPNGCNLYHHIGTIKFPNNPGLRAEFVDVSIYLKEGRTFQGLPNFATTLCSDFTTLPKEATVCGEATYAIDVSGSLAEFKWDNGSTNAIREVNKTGAYWVESRIGHCIERDTISVVFEESKIEFEKDTAYIFGKPLTLTPSGNATSEIVWHDNSKGPSYTASEPGRYSFTTSFNNCVFRDTVTVIRRELFVPNVITVNGDTRNEFFHLPFIRPGEDWEVYIYNRYGTEIFRNNSYQNNWQTGEAQSCFYRILNRAFGVDIKGSLTVMN